MKLSAAQTFKELEAGKFRPLYLIVGEEPFQVGEVLTRLKKSLLATDEVGLDSFNLDVFSGDDLSLGNLIEACETIPGLFDGGSQRMVVCHRFEKAVSRSLDSLVQYIKNPNPSSSLVLIANSIDKRKSWYKALSQEGGVISVSEPTDREWPRWQKYLEKKIGCHLEPEVWEVMVEASERRLAVLWQELQKVTLFVSNKSSIGLDDIRDFAFAGTSGSIFDFVDDVLKRRKKSVFWRYRDLIQSGESDLKLFALVVRQFRLLEQYEKMAHYKKDLAAKLGVHPFVVKKLSEQKKHHRCGIDGVLRQLVECDYKIKTGSGTFYDDFLLPYMALE